jgi:phage terminase large subunit-like protein
MFNFDYKKYALKKGISLKHFYFDREAAGKPVKFIESFCTHVKGELMGKKIVLEEWQKNDVIYPIFGFKRKEDDTRKFRTVYSELRRKNCKTTLIAGLALYLLCADQEPGAEVYSAAGDRHQAGIMHDIAKAMIKQNKTLSKKIRSLTNSIVYEKTNSFYKALSSESSTKHGFNAHAILFDELHVQKNRELWDTLTTSTGSRRQPLTIAITTAGQNKQSLCYSKHKRAQQTMVIKY